MDRCRGLRYGDTHSGALLVDPTVASSSCDMCGRTVANHTQQRLAFCQSCERFVCPVCWVADRNLCRACLMPGQVSAQRVRLAISETYVPSTMVDRRRRAPAPLSPLAPVSSPVATPPRPSFRVGAVVALGLLVIIGAAAMAEQAPPDIGIDSTASEAPVEREAVLRGRLSAPPTITGAPSSVIHVVQPGDTLIGLAERYYGDPGAWAAIREANRTAIPDPDSLEPGQELVIPVAP